jgi:hypothetical protein
VTDFETMLRVYGSPVPAAPNRPRVREYALMALFVLLLIVAL